MDWVAGCIPPCTTARMSPRRPRSPGWRLFGEIGKHMQQRRAEGLGDDFFSDILRGTLNGEPLDDVKITMYRLPDDARRDGHH